MPAIFSWENRIDGATLSAGSETTNLTAQNLADHRIQKCWRSLDLTTSFTATFPEQTVGILALAGCTLADTDDIRHRLYDEGNNLLYDTTVDSDIVDGYGLHVHTLDAEYDVAKWVCDITATSRSAEGFFDIGRAWAGPIWEPGISWSLGWSDGWNDTTPVRRGRFSGASFIGQGVQFRTINFTLDFLSAADRIQGMDLARLAGMRNQLLFVPDVNSDWARLGMIGRFTQVPRISQPLDVTPVAYTQIFEIQQDL